MKQKPKIIAVVGPTASGKSDLAVGIARAFSGEVISADSRQVYQGMDIGTGKITTEEMKGVTHHLLDVASPKRTFTVAQYKRKADKAVLDILKRGKLPILVGGTGFYIQAVTDGVVLPNVLPNPLLRKQLTKLGADELFLRLKRIDPERAATIDVKNPRRLLRAIEISEALGKVPALSAQPPYETLFIGIEVPNDLLRERIHKRLLARMDQGMINEAVQLHKDGLSWKRMEDLGLEYRYLARHLQGKMSKNEMFAALELEIMHYAKRQYTWFRKNKRIHWIELRAINDAKELVRNFLK
jgi:tRNA dimethylallyltransferase